ncbi:cytochrome P450 monooxygenase [Penicillium canescens]|nr:cytochrome P450 monooxygenase [Penicillium canescens]KAJ6025794.1 cytochrome P450 monooxygenase [Penicillium canescens]KAJ6042232.1 cytochrome P450 monooxygenase [Penicillium canescens]KAJ6076283.1 cytochrome P450 monooxygenase [Penicillium canescens]
MFLSLLILIVVAWGLGALGLPLYRNWSLAQRLKVPVIVSPIHHGQIWGHLQTLLEAKLPISWQRIFPFVRILRPQWVFREKHAIFEKYGNVFAIATPAGCEIYVADSKAASQILMRKKDFPKPLHFARKLQIFGKSLATVCCPTLLKTDPSPMKSIDGYVEQVDGADWNRHRRCTAVAFSETIHEAVWKASCSEASDLLKLFKSQDSTSSTHPNMIRLSFAILLKACLGLDNDSNNADAASPITDTAMKQLETFFNMISRNPEARKGGQKSRDIFHASYQDLKPIMTGLVNYRRHHPSSKIDLLSSMLSLHGAQMLSDEEIESNLFLFMFAGHETTANTLVYIVYLLAIFPEWQNWVIEEIDEIFSGMPLDNEISYKDIFNRVTRLKAIMYETLRLYGPVVNLLRRASPDQDQAITSSDGSGILIPASTLINILTPALHTNRDYWGSDSVSWKPDRWLSKENLDSEKVDHLFAWAEGPRACPGRKFSQLEISAVIVTLLRQTSVQIVPRPGVSLEEAKMEALEVLQNSRSLLTLHIERPELVHIKWCPR